MDVKLKIAAAAAVFMACCFLCVESAIQEEMLSGPGVNVCVRKRSEVRYMLTTKLFSEPIYKPILQRCSKWSNRLCSSYSTTYTTKFRKVKISKLVTKTFYTCCPGWTREPESKDCKIATCAHPCRNNGVCTKPNSCTCVKGWTGSDCSEDINECSVENGRCDQLCINTYGSYVCACREGYNINGKDCQVCLHCNKEWKSMESRVHMLEKELLSMSKKLMKYKGAQMLSHVTNKQDLRGPPGMKGEKGDIGPRGPPGPPAEVLASIIGRLAHFEEVIEQCQCDKNGSKEAEQEKKETEHAEATHSRVT